MRWLVVFVTLNHVDEKAHCVCNPGHPDRLRNCSCQYSTAVEFRSFELPVLILLLGNRAGGQAAADNCIFHKDNPEKDNRRQHVAPSLVVALLGVGQTGKNPVCTMNAALRAVTRVAPRAIARQPLTLAFKPLSTPSELFEIKDIENGANMDHANRRLCRIWYCFFVVY